MRRLLVLLVSMLLTGCGPSPQVQSIVISAANQWILVIRRDGGGRISQSHVYRRHHIGQIPEGTFDFEDVLDSLTRAGNQDARLRGVGCQVALRYGKEVPDRDMCVLAPKLIATLFGKAKEHARKNFSELDKLWAEKPPTSPSK